MQSLSVSKCGQVIALALILGGCGGGGEKSPATAPATGTSGSPSIQGQPDTSVRVGQAYSFQPTASDPDGDTLTFSANNLPGWASLNASTGQVTGTPSSGDVATYSGITITVSDGSRTTSLAPFSITVSDVGTGAATLSWTAPTQNGDGSALSDLAGYQVLYGRSATDLTFLVALDNPSLTSYVLDDLTAGTWYFAVVAVNSSGMTSTLSNVASKTIS